MPENKQDCPINGINCVSITRVEALERALEAEKEARTRAHEKIYDRLGVLERGMATVNTQYLEIDRRLSSISADLAAIKDRPTKRWDSTITAVITGLIGGILGFMLSRLGMGG